LEADHNPSLKSHWYDEGYKMTPEERKAWANDPDNLVTSCQSCNRSKGEKTIQTIGLRMISTKQEVVGENKLEYHTS
jgi:5-methylcytosine-specific restriction endonuclease McrA